LIEGLAAPVCRIGGGGDLQVVNPALAALLGYRSKGEMLELAGVLGVFATGDGERHALRELDDAGEAVARLRRKDGGTITARLRATVARDRRGRAQRFDVVVVPDVLPD
jgi:PAS domain-containing protein